MFFIMLIIAVENRIQCCGISLLVSCYWRFRGTTRSSARSGTPATKLFRRPLSAAELLASKAEDDTVATSALFEGWDHLMLLSVGSRTSDASPQQNQPCPHFVPKTHFGSTSARHVRLTQTCSLPEVPKVGLEPTRPCGHWILSPARLPFRHFGLARGFQARIKSLRQLCRQSMAAAQARSARGRPATANTLDRRARNSPIS